MGKIRINKLALELNIQNDDILNALKDKGHAVKNYMSSIDNTIADEIRQFFTHEPEPVTKKITPKATKKVTKKKATTETKVVKKKTSPKKKVSEKALPSSSKNGLRWVGVSASGFLLRRLIKSWVTLHWWSALRSSPAELAF